MKKYIICLGLALVIGISIGSLISIYSVRRGLFPGKKNDPIELKAEDYNIVFISLTNLRADHLSCYGYKRRTSPNIDYFARNSLIFENAFSPASWTLPVSMSIFTSTYPFTHGVMNRIEDSTSPKVIQQIKLKPSIISIVDILKSNGYTTAAFTGDRDYNPEFGLINRFNEYTAFENPKSETKSDKKQQNWKKYGVLENVAPAAINWISQNGNKKFFLFIHAYDLHCPFAVPKENKMFDPSYDGPYDFKECFWTFDRTEPITISKDKYESTYYSLKTVPVDGKDFEVKLSDDDIYHMIALYDGEIYNSDQWVHKILKKLDQMNLRKKTMIVFFSEHGDMFGKYGRFMRGGPLRGTFYDDVLHVPLIIHHPNLSAKRIKGLAQLIDIAPTLLELLNLPTPPSFEGKSLIPLIKEGITVNSFVYAGSEFTPDYANILFNYASKITMIRDHQWKLITEKIFYKNGPKQSYELFNIQEDPEELNNLSDTKKDILDLYLLRLNAWKKKYKKNQGGVS